MDVIMFWHNESKLWAWDKLSEVDGTLSTKWEVCERDVAKTPKTLWIALWSFNYREWGLNVQNMFKLLDLYIIENTQMKIKREWACIVRKNFLLIVMIFLKGNDKKMSNFFSMIQNGIWSKKSCLIEEFDKMSEILKDYKIRESKVWNKYLP